MLARVRPQVFHRVVHSWGAFTSLVNFEFGLMSRPCPLAMTERTARKHHNESDAAKNVVHLLTFLGLIVVRIQEIHKAKHTQYFSTEHKMRSTTLSPRDLKQY